MIASVLRNVVGMVLGFVVLMGSSGTARGAFVDTFDGPDRDSAWRSVGRPMGTRSKPPCRWPTWASNLSMGEASGVT